MGTPKYDIGIIGSGIIGLATAMRLSHEHPRSKIVVVEKESQIAQHQTGHNSGVIHAGICYAPGSQKANFCSTGGAMLRRFCDQHEVPYEMCGKLIVAVDESEVPGLEELFRRGTANGADGLEILGQERLREIEPHAAGVKAIWSPNTGIVDYDDVSTAYCDEMRDSGGELIADGDVEVGNVINCAGLHADSVALMMGQDVGVRIIPFRGEYLSLKPEKPIWSMA